MTETTLRIRLAAAQRHGRLTLFPVLTDQAAELSCRLLPEAIADGTLRITEVGSGTVPELLAVNEGRSDVLVLDGEQLVGARQNRMPNRSLLLPAGSQTKIPVSCMERGRWRFTSDSFESAPQHSPASVRRHARRVEARAAEAGAAAGAEALSAAQGDVWHEIDDVAVELHARSQTGALDRVYETRARDIGEMAARFPAVPGQVGLLAFRDDRVLGLDVIGGRSVYARVHPRLLRGYLLDALRSEASGGPGRLAGDPDSATVDGDVEGPGGGEDVPAVDEAAALRFLGRVREADRSEAPTVGGGRYRVLSGAVIGGELEDGPRLVHRSAFPPDPGPEAGCPPRPGDRRDRDVPIAGPRARRSRRG